MSLHFLRRLGKDKSNCQVFSPFVTDGFVALQGNHTKRIPIRILRDTGTSQSFMLENVLPFGKDSYTGSRVIVQGLEMGAVSVPLHHVSLPSDLVTGNVTVCIRPSLPVKGISMLLGNDLAGGNVLRSPVVTRTSPITDPDLNVKYTDVFHSCIISNTKAQSVKESSLNKLMAPCDMLVAHLLPTRSGGAKLSQPILPCLPNLTPSQELIVGQNNYPSPGPLFVSQLPRTKSGNQYLLTIMCTLMRFHEAILLQKITSFAVVKVLMVLLFIRCCCVSL